MNRRVLDDLSRARGWAVHMHDAGDVESRATRILAERADEVLRGPRVALGPPRTKDHGTALAAMVLAAGEWGADSLDA